jgi:DNA-directed RNA polymerase specialized sigma24 family protein
MAKLERSGAMQDPQRAEAALNRLNASERRAYLEAADELGTMPEAVNRAQRRRMEKMRKAQRGR